MPLEIEIVTAEKIVRVEQGVDVLVAPGSEGQLAILPKHAPLMTTLDYGELVFRRGTVEEAYAVGGGFMEVRNDHVTILADLAEAAEEIDIGRAEQARARAEETLRLARDRAESDEDLARAQASMQRALLRLRVAEKRRRGRGGGPGRPGE